MAKIIVTYKNEGQALENTLEISDIIRCSETYRSEGQRLNIDCAIPEDTSVFDTIEGAQILNIELIYKDDMGRSIPGYSSIESINSLFYAEHGADPRTSIIFA